MWQNNVANNTADIFKKYNYNSSLKKELKGIKNKRRNNQYYNFYNKNPIKTSVSLKIHFSKDKQPKALVINKYYLLQNMWFKVLLLFFLIFYLITKLTP